MSTKKKSRTVPKELKAKYEEVSGALKDFCEEKLNEEYYELACDLCAAISRKRPSPLLSGKANTWACGIIHALGTVNFLFDPSQTPHMSAKELYEDFGISSNTALSKSKLIRESFKMTQMDPEWTLPSKIGDNPFVWMIMVDGMVIDARQAPREIQEAAYRQGIIPYIPEESIEQAKDNKVIQFPENKKTSKRKSTKDNLKQAEELIAQAFEANSSKKRIQLANQALELSEDCAEAYIMLAEETAESIQEARELYEKALGAARRVLGEKVFDEDEGFFWLITETRPYMTIKWNLAEILWSMNEREEAINHLKDMLRLNKNDNQGVRYILINWLLQVEDYEYLEKLFKECEEDATAAIAYGEALYYFKKGNKQEASQRLKAAFETNPHVPKYMLGLKRLPQTPPDYIGFGDETEAQAYIVDAFDTWKSAKGALEWLKTSYKK